LYYNPNIEPLSEYEKRKKEQIRFINSFKGVNKIDYMDIDYLNEDFKKIATGLENEPEGGIRCHACYKLRLEKTAKLAKEHHYDYFTTTLTVSPYKNAQIINPIGEKLAKEYGINYLDADFKKEEGYKKSIELAKEFNLYRQDYCGCHFSHNKMINE
jgi:predicted adenine nucleotide alpha hydrolase (AANH) superfamily ATPase